MKNLLLVPAKSHNISPNILKHRHIYSIVRKGGLGCVGKKKMIFFRFMARAKNRAQGSEHR